MPISNPIKRFINGYDQREFLYEGGHTLWHFSPHDNGLSRNMEDNLIFFANDEAHALDVLKRAIQFQLESVRMYDVDNRKHKGNNEEFYKDQDTRAMAKYYRYLEALDNGKIKLIPAPTAQFYVVGWADNDTAL